MRNGLVISNTTIATEESRIYDGIRERNLSCVGRLDVGCSYETKEATYLSCCVP